MFEVFFDPFWCTDYSFNNADASFTHHRVIFGRECWVVHMWRPCDIDSDCALCHIDNSIRRDPGIISMGPSWRSNCVVCGCCRSMRVGSLTGSCRELSACYCFALLVVVVIARLWSSCLLADHCGHLFVAVLVGWVLLGSMTRIGSLTGSGRELSERFCFASFVLEPLLYLGWDWLVCLNYSIE